MSGMAHIERINLTPPKRKVAGSTPAWGAHFQARVTAIVPAIGRIVTAPSTADRRNLGRFLNLIVAAAFVAAVTIPAMTSDAPEGHWWGMDQVDRAAQPKNWPTWESHGGRPGFEDIARKPADVIPSALLVVKNDGAVVVMSLDEVFDRLGNETRADDPWTVGWAR
jgi:hypothetical protein